MLFIFLAKIALLITQNNFAVLYRGTRRVLIFNPTLSWSCVFCYFHINTTYCYIGFFIKEMNCSAKICYLRGVHIVIYEEW